MRARPLSLGLDALRCGAKRTGLCLLVEKLEVDNAVGVDDHGEGVEDFDALPFVLAEDGAKG